MADVVEGADVRMIEARNDARFAFEALARLGAHGEVPLQHLDRDRPVQAGVAREVDLAHPAGAQHLDDFVRPEA
jgi:hypothetical protein